MKPRVAILSEKKWAFGRVHWAIIKYMKQWYDFEFFDWGYECNLLYGNDNWKNFDIILGNTLVVSENGWMPKISQEYLNKCIGVLYTSAVNDPHFREEVKYRDGPLYGGITQQVLDVARDHYKVDCEYTPIGIDLEHFYPTRQITEIKRAGFVGNPANKKELKRVDMFEEICKQANIEPVFIFGKDMDLNNKLYDDIDVFIVTSLKEAVFLEPASCNIPVIIAKSPVIDSLNLSVKTFDTVEEAVDLIKWLQSDPNVIKEYTENILCEIKNKFDWKILVEQYWKPVFEKRLKFY